MACNSPVARLSLTRVMITPTVVYHDKEIGNFEASSSCVVTHTKWDRLTIMLLSLWIFWVIGNCPFLERCLTNSFLCTCYNQLFGHMATECLLTTWIFSIRTFQLWVHGSNSSMGLFLILQLIYQFLASSSSILEWWFYLSHHSAMQNCNIPYHL